MLHEAGTECAPTETFAQSSGVSLLEKNEMLDKLENQTDSDQTSLESIQKSRSKNEKLKIFLLIYLFFLQNLPTGLVNSLPLILIVNHVSYSDIGTFSLMMWPFLLRILWAPFVDAVYFKRFGRRRSWIIPTTLVSGCVMLTLSDYIQTVIYSGKIKSEGFLF
jgi:PAT family acetyl-CoA transporter-like MFS transporter 1